MTTNDTFDYERERQENLRFEEEYERQKERKKAIERYLLRCLYENEEYFATRDIRVTLPEDYIPCMMSGGGSIGHLPYEYNKGEEHYKDIITYTDLLFLHSDYFAPLSNVRDNEYIGKENGILHIEHEEGHYIVPIHITKKDIKQDITINMKIEVTGPINPEEDFK